MALPVLVWAALGVGLAYWATRPRGAKLPADASPQPAAPPQSPRYVPTPSPAPQNTAGAVPPVGVYNPQPTYTDGYETSPGAVTPVLNNLATDLNQINTALATQNDAMAAVNAERRKLGLPPL